MISSAGLSLVLDMEKVKRRDRGFVCAKAWVGAFFSITLRENRLFRVCMTPRGFAGDDDSGDVATAGGGCRGKQQQPRAKRRQ